MQKFDEINKFYCQKVLPLVYDDSLSYYEVLCKLRNVLNEVIKNQNEIIDYFINFKKYVDEKLKEYTEGVLNGWLNDGTIDNLINVTKFNQLKEDLENQINNLSSQLNSNVAQLQTNIDNIYVSVEKFPRLEGENDDTLRLQRALNQTINKILLIPYNTELTIGRVNLNTNQSIIVYGKINANEYVYDALFHGDNIQNVNIEGRGEGEINANTNIINGLSCIILNSVTNFNINGLNIKNFKNKGISISGNSFDGNIVNNKVINSNGDTGAGISLFGNNIKNIIIVNNRVDNNRIGIALNGNYNCVINNNLCVANLLSGIMLDGIVTASGDGAKNNIVNSNIIKECTNANYGGIYLGNGSSQNTISNNQCLNNNCSGIRLSGGSGYENIYNLISENVIIGNNKHGVECSYALNSQIINNLILKNSNRGITAIYCDNSKISNNTINENTNEGILFQSGNTIFLNNECSLNNKGLVIAYGGATPSNNIINNNKCQNNTVSQYVFVGTYTISNNDGYKDQNQGLAMFSGDASQTTFLIPHGLPATPKFVTVQQNSPTTPLNFYVTYDATNINVVYLTPPPNVVNGIKLLWSARL